MSSSSLDVSISGQAIFAISIIVITALSITFGVCLHWLGTTPLLKTTKRLKRVNKTVIRHRDPTEVVRDFEHEDEFDKEDPLEFEEEVVNVDEEEELDTGFEEEPVKRKL